jgi:Uma2 family endonuclease
MIPISEQTELSSALSPREQRIGELVERIQKSGYDPQIEAMLELTDLLPEADSEPLESPWHFNAIALLKETLSWHWRDRHDYFLGGNMFVYWRIDALLRPQFRGPDFFYVADVDQRRERKKWTVWAEGGKYPDLIVEFLSPSTAEVDRTAKKELYEDPFRTSEYFLYDPETGELEGWRLGPSKKYQAITPDERGWLWSERLQLWLGRWTGWYVNMEATWLRVYDAGGSLIQLQGEAEAQRARAAEKRADELAAENARLLALIEELRKGGPTP